MLADDMHVRSTDLLIGTCIQWKHAWSVCRQGGKVMPLSNPCCILYMGAEQVQGPPFGEQRLRACLLLLYLLALLACLLCRLHAFSNPVLRSESSARQGVGWSELLG